MRSIEGQIEEEWILLVFLSVNEADRIIGRNVGVVSDMSVVAILSDVDELVTIESVVGIIVRCVGVNRANGPSVEFMESPVIRCSLRVIAVQVPFVYQTCSIACCR